MFWGPYVNVLSVSMRFCVIVYINEYILKYNFWISRTSREQNMCGGEGGKHFERKIQMTFNMQRILFKSRKANNNNILNQIWNNI